MMRQALHLWRRFRADRRGVSIVEFAIIAPVMMILYFGLTELCQAMLADRRANHVASSVADLITQQEQVSPSGLNDIFAIANTMMAPFDMTTFRMCAASITADANDKLAVDWTQTSSYGAPSKSCKDTSDFPKSQSNSAMPFIGAGTSVVMARVDYKYTSPFGYFVPNGITFREVFYLRPRRSDKVTCLNGSNPCTAT